MVNNDPILIQTKSGLIQGSMTDRIRMFRRIPYASPPIDELRWAEPQYIPSWGNNTVDATLDPPGCPQLCELPPKTCPTEISEDCLYLNIYTPLNITTSSPKVPVLIFIHGGNFKQGYSGGLLYNGTDLVNYTNTILVSINYRLGVLGELWSIEAGMAGNYGFLDQKMAMHWIYNNIEFFGGDNTHITLFGQSAGAVSVALHLTQTSEQDSKLFQYAIMESEPLGTPLRDTTTWGALPKLYFDKVGCPYDIFFTKDPQELWKCLRNRTVSQVLSAQAECEVAVKVELDHEMDLFMPWTPTVGTDLFIQQPIRSFQNGNIRDIPFMIGSVMNEGKLFIYEAYPNGISRDQVMEIFAFLIGPDNAIKVREHYPFPANTTDYRDYVSLVATDGLFKCPTRNITAEHLQEKFGFKSPVYLYHFNHASSFNEIEWNVNFTCCWGDTVCHGEELSYVFHPNMAPINATYTSDEDTLAYSMQSYWTQFALTGSPGNGNIHLLNPMSSTTWFPFVAGSETSIQFQINNVVMQSQVDIQNSKCDFWDTLNYDWIK